MRRRFALVFNSTAGVAIPRLLDGVIGRLNHSKAEVFQVPARNSVEASERVADLASRGAADAVIAAGGDGTFRAVATGAAGTSLPVGLIPMGTGNVLAGEIGLPKGAAALADVLLTGKQIQTRGGLANGEPFFLMLGAGFDARVVARLSYRTKRALGRGAYVYPVIRTFAEAHPVFDVELDGRRFEASWVILSFATRYGSLFTLAPDAGLGRDTLIAVVMEAGSRRAIGTNLLALALGWLARAETRPRGVHILPVKAATIGRRQRAPFQVDGDEGGMSPVVIGADGPRVRLIVPPRYVADLTNCHTNRLAYEV
jgi:diacylglycerol kinase (ATP)